MPRPEPSVLMRADAGLGIGFGHLSRCLAVATGLIRRGVTVSLATTAASPEILARIEASGCVVLGLPSSDEGSRGIWSSQRQREDARALKVLSPRRGWDAVIVDHYQLDAHWEEEMRDISRRMVVLDDLANRRHSADVVVDHNWYGDRTSSRYSTLVPGRTRLLLGPRYAMLHPQYARARENRDPVSSPPRRVVVSFGGTDAGNQTEIAVHALLRESDVDIDVVLGTSRALTPAIEVLAEDVRVQLHVGLPTMVDLLARADLAFGAGGTGTWERLCLGVPAVVTTVNVGQSGVTKAFHEAGITRWLGTAANVTKSDYVRAIRDVLAGSVPEALPLADGHGAERVGLAVLPPQHCGIVARPARDADLPSFVTMGSLGEQGPDAWRARVGRFGQLLALGPDFETLEHNGVPVGFRHREDGVVREWTDQPGLPESEKGEAS